MVDSIVPSGRILKSNLGWEEYSRCFKKNLDEALQRPKWPLESVQIRIGFLGIVYI